VDFLIDNGYGSLAVELYRNLGSECENMGVKARIDKYMKAKA